MTKLKEFIALRGRTGVWIASQVGIEYKLFSRIVQGYVEPTPEDKEKIAELLETSVRYLWPKGKK